MNSFFMSQFSYFPLVGMCHRRISKDIINRLNEQCLRIIFTDKFSTLEELKGKYNFATIHKRNLRLFATEMFKIITGISSFVVNDLLDRNEGNNCNFGNPSDFSLPIVKTVFSRPKTVLYLGPKLWEVAPP